ncbi:ATP-binding cassette sub-family C member 2-like [Ruditapes philippinarum]|uniref:ATP-binding cassette sub-family C member 2-like n=1 Tax=Ruditapes philippinarum TaxID=129788 RepID=UPI00295AD0E6|nr:ATP-binding cassette sub-family C member 2-like [Ruditapes philippinarum]
MDTDLDIFHKFCGGETFWNGTKFFQAEPEFSLCFMNTVLVWIPCAFIWIAAPLFVLRISLSRALQPLPFAKLNLAKAIFSALAAVMIGLQLREVHVSGGKCVEMTITPAMETSCLIKIASFILTIMLQQYQRYKGIKTSAIPFTFWALLVMSEIPAIYTNIYKQKYFFCLLALEHYTYFLLIIVQLVLHCYAEKNKRTQQGTDKKSCPEEDVPFVSHMTYSWFSPTIKKIYAGTFDVKKFWALPSRLKNERVAPQLERAWNEEVNHCETKRLLTAKRGKYRHRNGYGLLDGGDGNVLHRMYMESWLTSEDTPLLSNSFSKKTKQRKRRNDEDKRCLKPNLYKALIKVFLKYWIEAVSFLILGQIAWYMIPLVLQYLIQVIDERDSDTGFPIPMWIAYFCCVAILIFTFANLFFHHTSFTHMLELGLNVKTALMALVYRKVALSLAKLYS